MESKLNLINAVREAKDREVGAFNHSNSLISGTLILFTLIISGDWDKLVELLCSEEVT